MVGRETTAKSPHTSDMVFLWESAILHFHVHESDGFYIIKTCIFQFK